MALELFKPFVMKELVQNGSAHNIKNAKKMVEQVKTEVWDVLEDVIKDHPVMLNRAPTLHRLGIQAFEPILVEGKAIRLHPMVCMAYNADFDGDQMAAHLPLTQEAQAECRFMLLSPNNLLKPSDGGVVSVPSQDMVLGIYCLTQQKDGEPGEGSIFKDINEAIMAYQNHVITLQSKVKVRVSKKIADGSVKTGIIDTSLGRLIFNEVVPQDLGYIDRTNPDNDLKLEIDFLVKKKDLKGILENVMHTHGATRTAETIDAIKEMGYKYSTLSAITVSVSDMTVPDSKDALIKEAEKTVADIRRKYKRGMLTEEGRYKEVVETWKKTDDLLTRDLLDGLDQYNNVFMMADSGARGSDKQIKQLAGMRGLMADTSGRTIELPIKSNFREGLDVLEYFMSAHGARKGLSDTALRTADSGYLTRRLVDVSQEMIIRDIDCAATDNDLPGEYVSALQDGDEVIETLEERITGRFCCEDIKSKDGDLIVKHNHMITRTRAARIIKEAVDENGEPLKRVKIRTILNCRSRDGVCAKCYGMNLATGTPVQVGEAIGIIAAQSIGEPGTQLTMRTFHTGGVAGSDITQGLPRVEELFEARRPKGLAIITEIPGVIEIKETKKKREVVVTNRETGETKTYLIPYGSHIKVADGQTLAAGDTITEGSVNPHDILKIKGVLAVQDYLLQEVLRVYRLQGVEINDKHIEVIVHQMLKRVRIEKEGDSGLLPGQLIDKLELNSINKKLIEEGKEVAEASQELLGITKASLATDSFLSAASFQETTKVLTDAAIKGKEDPLLGLKENVIIGQLIPAGTGMKRYRKTNLSTDYNEEIRKKALEAERLALEKEREEEQKPKKESKRYTEKADDTADEAEELQTTED